MTGRLILSLCDHTGAWSDPYRLAGYRLWRVDIKNGHDVRLIEHVGEPVHGILAAPPCTHFTKAGAWTWEEKGDPAILDGLAVVDACLRAVAIYRPVWWALENPIGRLRRWLGPPAWKFQPCQFGDPWTKETCLWGHFTPPAPLFAAQARQAVRVELEGTPGQRDRTSKVSSRWTAWRSATPRGFAQAFFEVNP